MLRHEFQLKRGRHIHRIYRKDGRFCALSWKTVESIPSILIAGFNANTLSIAIGIGKKLGMFNFALDTKLITAVWKRTFCPSDGIRNHVAYFGISRKEVGYRVFGKLFDFRDQIGETA